MNNLTLFPNGKTALVVAHPGHELRVFGWMKRTQPQVCILTDGSGRSLASRMPSSEMILRTAGATPGPIFGRFSDRQIYQALLRHDYAFFTRLADELAVWLIERKIEYIAGDAAEGYNSTHDVCRYLIEAACLLVERKTGRTLGNYDFLLAGTPVEDSPLQSFKLYLDEETFQAKLSHARAYREIAADVNHAFDAFGIDAFRHETLRPVVQFGGDAPPLGEVPYYELYGEQQVAAGHYQFVIRYRTHLLPLVEALRNYVLTGAL